MAIKSRAGIGGPKTQEGKVRSAQNSFKHGLTSSTPSSENEVQFITSLTKELVDYYKPQSPLELLQIDRIAICKAKLSHLYAVEQVKLALAHKELDLHPEKILEKISGAVGVTKLMALEMIQEGRIVSPYGLTIPILAPIVAETHMFSGVITGVQQFKKTFPLLIQNLNSYSVTGLNDEKQLPEKFSAIAQRVDQYLNLDENLDGKLEQFIYYQNIGVKYEALFNKYENTGFDKEIEGYQKESRMRYGLPEKDLTQKFIRQGTPDFLSTKTLNAYFRVFENLLRHMKEAEKVATQFFELKALMARSITLPASELSLLMRYQTTFERRLSSAIRELLELQKRAGR
ncbi:hypothetical protein [Polynucleobacter sp. UB-Piko-W3]|uniref:hypothetical protein n=1 Tax=Polynucleobacter sp. UB-Piko-W3 TaxID=1819735 RepID=UPI001C0DED7E|nr:hypothetical protein [Polynucleobacter sp. UB-Piko-W3]MBU3553989.1 hypothetical protein [Polynucleobacter sp. UB-Piko-W3]